jgi:transcriptional regulator with GAF, ATPase, and Fis domain
LFHGKVLGVLAIFLRREIDLNTEKLQRMIADHLAMAIANAEAFEKIESLKGQLELENEYLRMKLEGTQSYGDIVGTSDRESNLSPQPWLMF